MPLTLPMCPGESPVCWCLFVLVFYDVTEAQIKVVLSEVYSFPTTVNT